MLGILAALAATASPSSTVRTTVVIVVAVLLLPVALIAGPRGVSPLFRATIIGIGVAAALSAYLVRNTPDVSAFGRQATLLSLASNGLIVLAMILIARNRRGRGFHSLLADSAVIAVSVSIIAWVLVGRHHTAGAGETLYEYLTNISYLPLGAALTLLMAAIAFSDADRSPALVMIAAAIVATVAAEFIRASNDAGTTMLRVSDGMRIISLGFAGGAFAHPSSSTLSERQPPGARRPLPNRLYLAGSLAAAALVLAAAAPPTQHLDRVVRAVSVALLMSLLLMRATQSILANRRAQDALLSLAQSDQLTGLANRGHLLEFIEYFACNPRHVEGRATALFIDVDRFKTINDSLGHAAGDRVLSQIAARFTAISPPTATVARIAGDEFVVFDTTLSHPGAATELAERLLASLQEPMTVAGGDVFITASIGVAQPPPGVRFTPESLLRDADTAMYEAKAKGRNRVAMFNDAMNQSLAQRLAVETALYRALDRRELVVHHQPILDLASGTVIGFEALVRWQRADGTIVAPSDFIPIAEETGTIVAIGSWVLDEALGHLRTWIDSGVCRPTTTMSVNVSPQQLTDPQFAERVNEAILRNRVSPNLIWLEITEGVLIGQPELALANLRRLRTIGVRIAVDDFGIGYSALSRLQQFPLQRIKIDRSFVHQLGDDASSRTLVRTIIAMATSLGLDIVAEGVETARQLRALEAMGCHKAQGYLLSRPVPMSDMAEVINDLERVRAWTPASA